MRKHRAFRAVFWASFAVFSVFGTFPLRAVLSAAPEFSADGVLRQKKNGLPGVPYKRRPSRMARIAPPALQPPADTLAVRLSKAVCLPAREDRALHVLAAFVPSAPPSLARPWLRGRAPPAVPA